jgi:hypothetical protein
MSKNVFERSRLMECATRGAGVRWVHTVRPRMSRCEGHELRVAMTSVKMAIQFVHWLTAGSLVSVNCQWAILVRAASQCSSIRSV